MELYSRWVNLRGMPETPEHSPDISIPKRGVLESSPGPGHPSIVMSAALYSMQSGWVYKVHVEIVCTMRGGCMWKSLHKTCLQWVLGHLLTEAETS